MDKHLNSKPEKRWITFRELFERTIEEEKGEDTALIYVHLIMHIGATSHFI